MFEALMRKIRLTHEVPNPLAEAWHQQYRRTPDLYYLCQHARQLVFIADDLKVGKINHKLIEDHSPIHPHCYTLQPFTVYNKDLGIHSIPLPFEEGVDFGTTGWYKPELHRIQGELYALPSPLIWKVLDIQKENGLQFTRKRVLLTLPWREVTFDSGPDIPMASKIPSISKDYLRTQPAWMYVARPEYWDNYIGVALGTRAVPTYQHNTPKEWIGTYYKF
jgi:hypothetical protein